VRLTSVTVAVMESAAPVMYAAELRRHSSLVARKMALRICGPAIITNAIGRIFAVLPLGRPYPPVRSWARSSHGGPGGALVPITAKGPPKRAFRT
jgi:hypothetical protein